MPLVSLRRIWIYAYLERCPVLCYLLIFPCFAFFFIPATFTVGIDGTGARLACLPVQGLWTGFNTIIRVFSAM